MVPSSQITPACVNLTKENKIQLGHHGTAVLDKLRGWVWLCSGTLAWQAEGPRLDPQHGKNEQIKKQSIRYDMCTTSE